MTNKQITTVFLTYTTLGGYLKDPNNLKADFPTNFREAQKALDTLLSNLVIEAHSLDKIENFDLNTAISRIQDSYNECVKERREIEAAQAAEDILQAAAIAASIALVAVSWTGFGALGLGIASVAAEAAATAADIGVKELEKGIIKSISDMGLKAYNDPALQSLKTYHEAADQVSINIAKLELGGNKADVRQSLLGLAKTSETVVKLKQNLIDFFNVAQKPGDIIGKFIILGELMLKGDGGPKAEEVIISLNKLDIPKNLVKTGIFTVATTGIVLSTNVIRFQKQIANFAEQEGIVVLEELDTIASITVKAARMAIAVKALAVLGALLEVGLLGLSIYEQRKFIDHINRVMNERKNALVTYYTHFHAAVTGKAVTDKPLTIIHTKTGSQSNHSDDHVDYKTWGGANWTSKILPSGDFLHTAEGQETGHTSAMIDYLSGNGEWRATLDPISKVFTHTQRGANTSHKDIILTYRSWDNSKWNMKLK